jgi:hypothetical protein
MAKTTAVRTAPTELAVVPEAQTALAVATGFDASDARGKSNITQEDVTLPRLAICQAMSPEKNDDDAKYIEDLKEGDLFNSLTGTIYGKGPIEVIVIDLKKRALEFEKDPVTGKQTKKILDFNVPWRDPRCEFTEGPAGRVPPVATRFYDFIALVPSTLEPVVLSMSRTKIPVAKRLNSLLSLRPGAAWAGMFRVSASREEKNGNKYFNYKIQPAGPTPAGLLPICESMYQQFEHTTVKVEGAEPDDTATAPPTDDNVPF